MDKPNKFINKDDYMLFNNNMTASEQSRDDKSVSKIIKSLKKYNGNYYINLVCNFFYYINSLFSKI